MFRLPAAEVVSPAQASLANRLVLLCVLVVGLLPRAMVASMGTGCPSEFEGKCHCSHGDYEQMESYITNCTDSGFGEPTMLRHLPPKTSVLLFTGNNIPYIFQDIVGSNDDPVLPLRVIDLSNNQIEYIRDNAFADKQVDKVSKLVLSQNQWRINENSGVLFQGFRKLQHLYLDDAFHSDLSTDAKLTHLATVLEGRGWNHNLENMQELSLQNNGLQHISDDTFLCYLPNLRQLHLEGNEITYLNLTTRCTAHIQTIDLRDNSLTTISPATMQVFDSNKDLQVDLMGNPFHCDCSLTAMIRWLNTTSVSLRSREVYMCNTGYPKDLIGRSLTGLDTSELHCEPLRREVDYGPRAGFVILAVVLVIIAGLAAGVIYTHRDGVQRCWHSSTDPIRRKLQYTSIGRRDVEEVDV